MPEIIVGMGSLMKRIDAISSPAARREYLGKLGLAAVREAKFLVRRKTGNTGRTIALAEVADDHVTIEAGGAAVFLEGGTRPHIIRARRAKALRWATSAAGRKLTGSPRKNAAVSFARSVRHPGTKPMPFLRPGAEKAIARFAGASELMVARWNRAA